MITILIATDFSTASRRASIYGIELARLFNAKVILFNAYHVSHPVASLNVSVSEYGVMKETQQKLTDELNDIMPNKGLDVETVCEHGTSEGAILSIAREKNADFIIMGMKGNGKSFRQMFGSTATLLAKNSEIPIIIIPEEVQFAPPATIVFASDINLETNPYVVDQLADIVRHFKSKLYVVRVVTNKDEESLEVLKTPHELSKLGDLEVSYQFPVDTNITHGLNDFIEKHRVDMLVMMPHKHTWAERLFRKSETKDMLFHTHVPLLILPEKQSH